MNFGILPTSRPPEAAHFRPTSQARTEPSDAAPRDRYSPGEFPSSEAAGQQLKAFALASGSSANKASTPTQPLNLSIEVPYQGTLATVHCQASPNGADGVYQVNLSGSLGRHSISGSLTANLSDNPRVSLQMLARDWFSRMAETYKEGNYAYHEVPTHYQVSQQGGRLAPPGATFPVAVPIQQGSTFQFTPVIPNGPSFSERMLRNGRRSNNVEDARR